MQEALWRHVVRPLAAVPGPTVRFTLGACGVSDVAEGSAEDLSRLTRTSYPRKCRRSEKSRGPRTYRTRPDAFADEWEEIVGLLAAAPERTAKSLFHDLHRRAPERHPVGQLRTFQRRVTAWRAQAILEFTDEWLADDVPLGKTLPGALHLRGDASLPASSAG